MISVRRTTSARRRRVPFRGARLFAVLGVVAATLAWPGAGSPASAAVSCTDGGPCLLVRVVGSRAQGVLASQQFTADQIDNDPNVVKNPQFVQRAPGGHQDLVVPAVALPLTDLIGEIPGMSAAAVTYAEVIDQNGFSHDLDHQQLQAPPGNGFADGLSPSVWAETAASNRGMNSFRPLEADDPTDANASDWVTTNGAPDQALVIVLHKKGGILHPSITGPDKVRGETPARFHVTVPDAPPGLQFQWSVDRVLTSASPTRTSVLRHTWPDVTATTSSLVTVDVTGTDSSTGSASFVVTVCPKAGNTARCTKAKPDDGPGHPGGGHHHGQDPPTGPTDSGGHQQGGRPNGSQAPQAPSNDPGPSSPADGPRRTPGTGDAATTQRHSSSRSGKGHGGPVGGRTVSGQLLAASASLVVPQQQPTVTAAAPAARPTELRWSWPWRWAAILVIPLLVCLGMAGESLQLRRRLAKMAA